jgi:hypothetical protein
MKAKRIALFGALAAFTVCSAAADLSAADPNQAAIHRRAVEAVNWGMPAVNADLMLQAMIKAGGGANQIAIWAGLPNWKNQTLTPNPDTIYFIPFINTKDSGPMVMEVPPAGEDGSITGDIVDFWQAALEGAGPAGADKGKGGKFLFLPPGYAERVPEGYIALPTDTYQNYALLRSILRSTSAADVAKAVVYAKKVKVYPLSQAANPPLTKFVDVLGTMFDSTIPYDLRFFESLNRIVQMEPWLPRDKIMIDMLKTIGIEKGKPFHPDDKTKAVLNAAAREAHDWLHARFATAFAPYFAGRQWAIVVSQELVATAPTFWEQPDNFALDTRGLAYTYIFVSVKHLGGGQFYLATIKDKAGQDLDGGGTYRLTVPANAPARQYWSAVLYDREIYTLIRDVSRASRSSQSPGLQKNPDGSVDLYFGPQAPAGKESNWIPTIAGNTFWVMFRFYGPEKTLFDKTWELPDVEKVK